MPVLLRRWPLWIALAGLALALVAALACSRGTTAKHPAVLFVGLDGADWQFLDPLMQRGTLPNLATLVRDGRSGVVRTLHPPLSPLVWTTMMTGVSPLTHGVLDFTRFHPVTRRREPITSAERRVPAVWNIASARGRSVAVFGMWATWPAEAVNGLIVADRLYAFQRPGDAPAGACVFPATEDAWARRTLGEVDRETGAAALREFVPDLRDEELAGAGSGDPVTQLRRIVVQTRLYHRLALESLTATPRDLAILYIQGTDTIGHVFAPYVAPAQSGITARDAERFGGVAERYFRSVDALLGEYMALARRRGATLVIASDHGFRWGDDRPTQRGSAEAATAGLWHRDEGLWVIWGAGIAPASRQTEPVSVARTLPTILALLDVAPSAQAADPPFPGVVAPAVPSVDDARDYRPPAAATPADDAGAAAQLEELRALGYVGTAEAAQAASAPSGTPAAGDATRTASSFNNEGLLLLDAGRPQDAAAAFERAIALDPHVASAAFNLSGLLFREARDLDRADTLLVTAAAAGLPTAAREIWTRAAAYDKRGDASRASALLDRAVAAVPDRAEPRLYRGRLRLNRGDCRAALTDLTAAARVAPENAVAAASVGLAQLCLGDTRAAAQAFERSLTLDPHQPELRATLDRLR